MKKTKAILSMLLTCVMLVAITGCSSNSKPSSTTKETTTKEVANITFWHLWKGGEADEMQKVVDEFNKTHPQIHVNPLSGTTSTKQLTALTGGNPPDIGYVIDYTLSKWASVGAVAPLDDMISKYKIDSKNYPDPVWKLGNYGGKQYAIPYTMDSYMLYYNKDMLAAAGIKDPPKTISELKKDALLLTKKDAKGAYTQLGYVSDFPWLDVLNMSFAYGEKFYDYKTDKVTCNSKENIEALSFKVASYQNPYNVAEVKKFKSGFGEYESPNNPFFQKQLAFDIEGEWFTTFLKKYAKDINYGMVPIPYPDGHPELSNGGQIQSGMLYVSKACKNKDAAYEFINWLTSDSPNINFCTAKGSLPASLSAINSPEFTTKAPELVPFIQIVKSGHANALPAVPFTKEYVNELTLQEQKAYDGEITPTQALDNVAKKIQPMADEWVKSREK
ncbi:ABC transporter substrate-binding protein [Clostridium estertheticum]|uniref:ABC transporter substrate-binding protein n=1 Tax=Clostridium estertheticum TaxID=238834 RepID=UPI0013E9606C|nr:ABC transporter substrate-binding protein [Clostridium estertheticum]MBZ9686902.1 ABC transporter substrate-binding protein [Clostridium estertheticum]